MKELDPILHAHLRLAVVSLLVGIEHAEFNFLKEKTGASAGNLSIQLGKLKDAGYITIEKSFKNNYPQTTCAITPLGLERLKEYSTAIKEYLKF